MQYDVDPLKDIIIQIELHSVDGIQKCFSQGVNPNVLFKGVPLIYELTSEYKRGPEFKKCVRTFVDAGLQFEDKILLAVLLDDSKSLEKLLANDPEKVHAVYRLRCSYTPLFEVTLLHICAEYNHFSCADVLMKYGADVNAKAGFDKNGFGGQTPIFHAVNQNGDESSDMLTFLLANKADLKSTVPGLIWGKSYEWETLIPAVNPISYAMMGLLPQMHRREETISNIVVRLLRQEYGIDYKPKNVPNKYVNRK